MKTSSSLNIEGRKLLICEEALIDYKGHFYSWIKAIRAINAKEGVKVFVASNIYTNEQICQEFDCIRIYKENSWEESYNSKSPIRRYLNVFAHNFRLIQQNLKLLKTIGNVDCVVLPAVRIYHIIAWRVLCFFGLGKKFGRLVLFVLTSEAVYNDEYSSFHFRKSSFLIKIILRSFKKEVLKGNVILAGDSIITCKEYERLTGIPFRVFPSPAAGLNAVSINSEIIKERECTFVILGVSSMEKGINILQEALISLLTKSPDFNARFIIQWANPFKDYDGNEVVIKDELRNFHQVHLIETVLDEDNYKKYMETADFIMLPYRKNVYFNRISGVAIEAACSGIPMIVTKNTWLEMIKNEYGAGLSIEDGDFRDLEAKINIALNNRYEFKRVALDQQKKAIENNSSYEYLNCLWN